MANNDKRDRKIKLKTSSNNRKKCVALESRLSNVHCQMQSERYNNYKYSRLSLSRNRRDPLKHFEMSVIRHIRVVVLRTKQFEQPTFTYDYVICLL